jgi:hypothetical protein
MDIPEVAAIASFFFRFVKGFVPRIFDLARFAMNIDAWVSDARNQHFSSFVRSQESREQLFSNIDQLLSKEILPEACRLIDSGTPPIEATMPAIIAAGSTLSDCLGLTVNGRQLQPVQVASLMVTGHPNETGWSLLIKSLIPVLQLEGSMATGRSTLGYFQRVGRELLQRVTSVAPPQTAATENTPKAHTPTADHPTGKPEKVIDGLQAENLVNSPTPHIPQTSVPLDELLENAKKYQNHLKLGGRLLLDEQRRIALEIVNKLSSQGDLIGYVHLVRGIAGSGKTVLLGAVVPYIAEKFLNVRNEAPRILIYHRNNYLRKPLTRELNGAFKAHGRGNREFLVYHIWDLHKYLTQNRGFRPIGVKFEGNPSKLARHLLEEWNRRKIEESIFNLVFVDEGQDISEEEYKLLWRLSGGSESAGSLFVFYDDFQNVFTGGNTRVSDRVKGLGEIKRHALGICVRSSKEILDFAINTVLGPSCDLTDREIIEDALAIMDSLASGGLSTDIDVEDAGWPDGFYSSDMCVFKGGKTFVYLTSSDKELEDSVSTILQSIRGGSDGSHGTRLPTCLVLCSNKVRLREIWQPVKKILGHQCNLALRSELPGSTGYMRKKETDIVVPGEISFATIHDAKGNDADIVVVVDPDDTRNTVSALEKRALFYVATTRAKELVFVVGVKSLSRSTPILDDALAAWEILNRNQLPS